MNKNISGKIIDGIEYVNCCPHKIAVVDEHDEIQEFEKNEDALIRVKTLMTSSRIGRFKCENIDAQFIDDLPPKVENRKYIVSRITAQVLRAANVDRDDFLALGEKRTSELVEDKICRVGFVSI